MQKDMNAVQRETGAISIEELEMLCPRARAIIALMELEEQTRRRIEIKKQC